MIRAPWPLLFVLSIVPLVGMAGEPYRDPAYGFSIAPPVFAAEKSLGMTVTAVTFQGALKDGGTPSCNVQVQNVAWTPQQYKELSMNQFSALGVTLMSEESRTVSMRPALLWRVSHDKFNGINLAVFDKNRVFLVSCLSAPKTFAEVEASFISAIDSFKIEDRSE